MIYPKIPLAQNNWNLFSQGITTNNFPGSRNAPLTIVLQQLLCYSIAWWTCGCFFYGDCVTDKTAHSACMHLVLHYWIIILLAEAFYSQIPLIVISADRPQSKIDIGDGQTIDKRMYWRIILYNANLNEVVSVEMILK
jgi:2-succinyl-5-enolpyruvyl-6-hydroxy-3-cyclohexene-1-carboxylate synthase